MRYTIFMIFILLVYCSCDHGKATPGHIAAGEAPTIAMVKEGMLGKDIGHLPVYPCFAARDTSLEGDEGVQWKGKAFYSDSELVFLAEASWVDAKKVHRITIVGPQVKEGGLFVDQRFADIRGMVSDKISTSPDGIYS